MNLVVRAFLEHERSADECLTALRLAYNEYGFSFKVDNSNSGLTLYGSLGVHYELETDYQHLMHEINTIEAFLKGFRCMADVANVRAKLPADKSEKILQSMEVALKEWLDGDRLTPFKLPD